MIGGSIRLCASTEYPTKFSLKSSGSSQRTSPPAMKQYINKNVNPRRMSIRPGCPNPGSARGTSDIWFQLRPNGTGERGRSHVTRGTTTVVTSIFLLPGLVAETLKLDGLESCKICRLFQKLEHSNLRRESRGFEPITQTRRMWRRRYQVTL